MGSSDNYFPGTTSLTGIPERTALVMKRMRDVIEGSELIRKECNRIRNEFLSLGLPPDTEFTSLLRHLQIDMVALRVKFGYMTGLKGDDLQRLLDQLENPHVRMDNEDPA